MTSGAVTDATLISVVLIALAVALAPLVADRLSRWLPVPTTVLEIIFGVLLGPAVFGLVRSDAVVEALAAFGLAMLFFLAGYEINFSRIKGAPLARAFGSWGGSLLLGLALGGLLALLLGGGYRAAFVLGLALTTTALGTILPTVRDSGVLPTRLGAMIMAVGAVGEFAPIVVVAVLLGDGRPLPELAFLVLFVGSAMTAALLAMRRLPPRVVRLLAATLGTSAQFAVRLSVLTVLALVLLAVELHLDLALGAFAAGIVVKLVLTSISRREAEVVESKLEGLGFGVLVPFYFVATGIGFDLAGLLRSPAALALVPVGLAAFVLVRGVPVGLAYRRQLPWHELRGLCLYGATALPLVVVITGAGVSRGWLTSATAAGLVGAAMLSVLIFPPVAQLVVTGRARSPSAPAAG